MVNVILIQAMAYGMVMICTILAISVMFRGYFWLYIRVRTSFGKYLMVKIRSTMRDYFAKGWVEDGFLIYKAPDKTLIRIAINSKDKVVYRCLAVNWIDVDDETHSICKVDYSVANGFDSKKFSDLLTRALMRPAISSMQEKIIIGICLGALIGAGAAAWLSYLSYSNTQVILTQFPNIIRDAIASGLQSRAVATAANVI